jgi:hypothetical protein
MGPRLIANFETLGYVDLGPNDYFRHGTSMHVSHVFEDLEAWYLNFDFAERVDTAFRPGLRVARDTQTVRQAPRDVSTDAQVKRQFRDTGRIGHSAAIQTTSRLLRDHVAEDGTVYEKGTAIPVRADFNTLDNPFAYSAHPLQDGMQAPGSRDPLRGLQSDQRRLPPQPARDGRRAARRDASAAPGACPRSGLQRRAADDPPPELPRPAEAASLVPAR